jgi:hypothetical protein
MYYLNFDSFEGKSINIGTSTNMRKIRKAALFFLTLFGVKCKNIKIVEKGRQWQFCIPDLCAKTPAWSGYLTINEDI